MRRSTVLFVAILAPIAAVGFPAAAGAATTTRCAGVRPTLLVGVHSPHSVRGTNHRDVILIKVAGHIVDAGGGNDLVCGSTGRDIILGGAGDDRVLAGGGNDDVRGGTGNDRVRGGAGADRELGDAGADDLAGEAGDDRISGGTGNDVLSGGAGTDDLAGGAGEDRLSGGTGTDHADGGQGADSIEVGAADQVSADRSDRRHRSVVDGDAGHGDHSAPAPGTTVADDDSVHPSPEPGDPTPEVVEPSAGTDDPAADDGTGSDLLPNGVATPDGSDGRTEGAVHTGR